MLSPGKPRIQDVPEGVAQKIQEREAGEEEGGGPRAGDDRGGEPSVAGSRGGVRAHGGIIQLRRGFAHESARIFTNGFLFVSIRCVRKPDRSCELKGVHHGMTRLPCSRPDAGPEQSGPRSSGAAKARAVAQANPISAS